MDSEARVIENDIAKTYDNLEIKVPAVPEIDFDYSLLKAAVENELKNYEGDWYKSDDPEILKSAKRTVTALNKQRKTLNDKKIEVKRTYSEPLKHFEDNIKDILALYDTQISDMKTNINAANDFQKAAKLEEIKEFYFDMAGVLSEMVSFDVFYDPKWLNKTVSTEAAKIELGKALSKTHEDYEMLQKLKPTLEYPDEAEKAFFTRCNLQDAIDADLAEIERQRRLASFHEVVKPLQPTKVEYVEPVETSEYIEIPNLEFVYPVTTRILEIEATEAQFADLITYLKSQGIHGILKGPK